MKKNKIINLTTGSKTKSDKKAKYSELLDQFIAPFKDHFAGMEYMEDIFDFGIAAWNFGNMSLIIDNEEFEDVISSHPVEGVDAGLLKKMVDYKIKNFKEFDRFIVDYEINEQKDEPTLKVITMEKETYLERMFDEFENEDREFSQYDFEENYIDRNAIVLKPLQPLIDWHNNLYPDSKIDDSDLDDVNIYLINDKIDDIENHLKKKYDTYFTMELNDWHTHKPDWPQKRNYKMFRQWFQITTSTMVYDLEKKPVSKLI